MKYRLMVASNSRYMDGSPYSAGEYESLDKAIETAKRMVDRSLVEFATRGRTGEELYEYYCLFGDDPYIIGGDEAGFSAWQYAKSRCSEFDGEPWHLLVALQRFAEAEPLMLAGTEMDDPFGEIIVARAEFYEQWGDAARTRVEAEKAYHEAIRYLSIFASWATSGGEGTARMAEVSRVVRKLETIENADR